MKIFVKSARSFIYIYESFDAIRSSVIRRSAELTVEPKSALCTVKSFLLFMKTMRKSILMNKPRPSNEEYVSISDHFGEKDRDIILSCMASGIRTKTLRHSIALTVKPTLTVGAFKSMLKPTPWIPDDNLLLVKRGDNTPLEDESSTLGGIGIKDHDTLLACMGGNYPLNVYSFCHRLVFSIQVGNCFETLGDVKDKLHEITGYPREDQILCNGKKQLIDKDEIPLVALGIVRAHTKDMAHTVSLTIPKLMLPGSHYP